MDHVWEKMLSLTGPMSFRCGRTGEVSVLQVWMNWRGEPGEERSEKNVEISIRFETTAITDVVT